MNTNYNNILLRINDLCQEYGWNHYRLAKMADIPLASLNSMFHRNTYPSLPTLEKICDGFQISMKDFFEFDKKLHNLSLTKDEQYLYNEYRQLSRTDKKRLLSYVDGINRQTTPNDELQ